MKNLRKRPRIEINHIVTCTCHDGKDNYMPPCEGMLINVSTNGAMIETKLPLEKKSIVLSNNSPDNPRLVKGEIVYSDVLIEAEESVFGLYRAGIKFCDLHENSKEFVVSIVKPTAVVATKPEHAPNYSTDFDADTIHMILDDETPTEDILLIEELLEEDSVEEESSEEEFDALEDVAIVLEEIIESDSAVSSTEDGNENVSVRSTSEKFKFIKYLNSVLFLLVCLSIIGIGLFLKQPALLSGILPAASEATLEIPFVKETAPDLFQEVPEVKPENLKMASLVKESIKSSFVEDEIAGVGFVISGLVKTSSNEAVENVKIIGRIFDKDNMLLGKESCSVKKRDSNISIFTFNVLFSNPPSDISRFTVDIEI